MDIILLQKVDNLGDLGEKVKVKSGYGRNYLIPSGRAIPATAANLAEFEARRAELEKGAADKLAAAEARKEKLEGLEISISCKAGDEGRLFGSVGTIDIAKAVNEAGGELEKQEVRLPNGPFRVAGDYEVELHLHTDVNASLKLQIVPEA
ncbi:50S ribosomal protein L9 [Candidatus Endoriftia persephonae]|jgi:large subunit ribosomal protein L9|uniref:Large ribosomal subunit protein bL9 n=4 Tax=Gammaproteobacteria TaxID=1236 RepID=G2FCG1_9GAMM|nr:50S ribosomal protein L9 [Candidatus Endoriftia persephone]EGW55524.1 50S ribosomal protein L9 [endosymbiont of Tevnia jerichonana (vent Tica)]KRT55482.1 LSU ribosomal protein L9P [endosymbiont of Ridgeia piscesae]KRT59311.1 LSU ribosomal protein L9P [endosymbiont of Ridgeia piscesae]USF86674.1 50S ribosomal protein L9 [Candidatus Endoriftia persephone]